MSKTSLAGSDLSLQVGEGLPKEPTVCRAGTPAAERDAAVYKLKSNFRGGGLPWSLRDRTTPGGDCGLLGPLTCWREGGARAEMAMWPSSASQCVSRLGIKDPEWRVPAGRNCKKTRFLRVRQWAGRNEKFLGSPPRISRARVNTGN